MANKNRGCCVPGCVSNSRNRENIVFFNAPSIHSYGKLDPLKVQRYEKWMNAIQIKSLEDALICSRHFVNGKPAPSSFYAHVDWIPSLNLNTNTNNNNNNNEEAQNIANIITNLPEVNEEFDTPEYVMLDNINSHEAEMELTSLDKYITNSRCEENSCHIDDHDYIGLPILRGKSEKPLTNRTEEEHNYSTREPPACLFLDMTYFCNICKRNNNSFSFNSHMMEHTLRNDVTCTICQQSFLTTTCLNTHIALHRDFCRTCGNQVPVVQIQAHFEANRRQLKNLNNRLPDSEKVYFCLVCMKGSKHNQHFHWRK